jgi:hypothetical protein
MQVKPELEDQVQEFKRNNFRPVTIGMQIRCPPPAGGRADIDFLQAGNCMMRSALFITCSAQERLCTGMLLVS